MMALLVLKSRRRVFKKEVRIKPVVLRGKAIEGSSNFQNFGSLLSVNMPKFRKSALYLGL